jgi:hypothetical protein
MSKSGIERLNAVLAKIDRIPSSFPLSSAGARPPRELPQTQHDVAMQLLRASLPSIVGKDEWHTDPKKLLQMLGVDPLPNRGGILPPPRRGIFDSRLTREENMEAIRFTVYAMNVALQAAGTGVQVAIEVEPGTALQDAPEGGI